MLMLWLVWLVLLGCPGAADELPRLTEDELETYDGSRPGRPVLLAVGGDVFDVSEVKFYQPGGPYSAFAGKACTRALALPSMNPSDVSDDLADFDAEQHAAAQRWHRFFQDKYTLVAKLDPDTSEQRQARLARRAQLASATEHEQQARVQRKAETGGGTLLQAAQLALHDGSREGMPILLAVGGHVLDVSASAYLYGPGKPRAVYAGKDITRALARNSIQAEDIAKGSDLFGLSTDELSRLNDRLTYFLHKFDKVGELAEVELLKPSASKGAEL